MAAPAKKNIDQLLFLGIAINVLLLLIGGFTLYKVKYVKKEVLQIRQQLQRLEQIALWQYGGDYELAKQFFENPQVKEQSQAGIKEALKMIGWAQQAQQPTLPPEAPEAIEPAPPQPEEQIPPQPEETPELQETQQQGAVVVPEGEDPVIAALQQELGRKYRTWFEGGVLSQDQLNQVLSNLYIKGNEQAPVIWLEYSDLQCPFCARLHKSGAIDNVMKRYEGSVAYGLKHFPLDFHKQALPAANVLECVGAKLGKDVYFKVEEDVFASGDPSPKNIYSILKKYGVSDAKIDEIRKCAEAKTYENKIKANMAEGQDVFGVRGTPGNVILDTRTGRWILIPGAYPEEVFDEVVKALLEAQQ